MQLRKEKEMSYSIAEIGNNLMKQSNMQTFIANMRRMLYNRRIGDSETASGAFLEAVTSMINRNTRLTQVFQAANDQNKAGYDLEPVPA